MRHVFGHQHHNTLKTNLKMFQRRATKLVPQLKDKPYEERLRILKVKLPSLCYRRRRSDIIQMYKVVKKIDSISSNSMFTITPSHLSTTRGHTLKMQVHHAKGTRSRFFSTRSIPVWNGLSAKSVTALYNIII